MWDKCLSRLIGTLRVHSYSGTIKGTSTRGGKRRSIPSFADGVAALPEDAADRALSSKAPGPIAVRLVTTQDAPVVALVCRTGGQEDVDRPTDFDNIAILTVHMRFDVCRGCQTEVGLW